MSRQDDSGRFTLKASLSIDLPPRSLSRDHCDADQAVTEAFRERFIAFSQFKRFALPNGPKVDAGGCIPPHGDWRAPGDIGAAAWITELKRNVL